MSKSICIKLDNKNISDYLLNELEYFELNDVYISCYKFKIYTNIIIHYVGKDIDLFLNKISTLLTYVIIDLYEPQIIQNMINTNYFYFSTVEKKTIYNLCLTNIDFKNSLSMIKTISDAFYNYFLENKSVILSGFVAFKISNYFKELDSIVEMCVNKFIIDKEYIEFINLLKAYIDTTPCNSNAVHLVYKNHESKLFDSDYKQIEYNDDFIPQKYLSDISFSSNDYALNSLLTLLPKKLYIHLDDFEDDFITTLKKIFDKHVCICKTNDFSSS